LSTAERFKRKLDLLAPRYGAGRWVLVPESRERLARRSFAKAQSLRRRIFVFLVAAVVVSLLVAVVGGEAVWRINLALDASLVGYIALLLDAKRRRRQRRGDTTFDRAEWTTPPRARWQEQAPFEVKHI
jgi:Flp pilus assembly protein TadB